MSRTASSPLAAMSRHASISTLAFTAPSLGAQSVTYSVAAQRQLIFEEQYLAGGICFPGYRQLFTFLRLATGLGITQWVYSEDMAFTISLQV